MSNIKLFLIGTLLFMSCSKSEDKIQRAVGYYKNGQLDHEVLLKNGKPEGLGITYYESGKVLSKVNWKDGKKHGQSIFYYENGKLHQEAEYYHDTMRKYKEYTDDGFLRLLQIYDSLGRLFDSYNYKKDGTRDFGPGTKDPIFIPETDTIEVGEYLTKEIRLGNRQYSHVDVIIGDVEDQQIIKKNKPLPKKDSLTSILKIKADSVGLREVSGVVFERTGDSMDVIPFTHRYYVIPKK